MDNQDRQYYPFRQFAKDVVTIAEVLQRMEASRGQKFKKIYAPLRGGAILAVCLSHQLSDEKAGRKVRVVVTEPPSAYEDGMLVVDDIADTGKTLHKFAELGFPIVTLFKQIDCSFTPTIWLHVKRKNWIEFWWEASDLLLDSKVV